MRAIARTHWLHRTSAGFFKKRNYEQGNANILLFLLFHSVYLKDGFYCNLVTLYHTVMDIEHEVEINEYGRANLRKMKFLLRHAHCKHYHEICFLDQIEYIILQRKHAMAAGSLWFYIRDLGRTAWCTARILLQLKFVGPSMATRSWQMQ